MPKKTFSSGEVFEKSLQVITILSLKPTNITHRQIQAENTSFSYLSNSKVKGRVCRKHGIVSFSETLPEPFESHHLPENWQVWKCERGFTKI